MSHFLKGEGQHRSILRVFGASRPKEHACTCGQPLPGLKKYGFSCLSEKVGDYLMGQCPRCRTIFWDAAVPIPEWVKEGVLG
jgi:hypothetical protein